MDIASLKNNARRSILKKNALKEISALKYKLANWGTKRCAGGWYCMVVVDLDSSASINISLEKIIII